MSLALPTPSRGPSPRTVAACAAVIAVGSVALGASGLSGVGALRPERSGLIQALLVRGRGLLEARALVGGLPRGPIGVVAPAEPFVLRATSLAERQRAVRCLSNAVYYEAATEPTEGQRAVAQVVLNRVRDPNFPKSICGVVYQGWERQSGCQFSFTCDGSLLRGAPDAALMANARRVAEQALAGQVAPEVGTATHYHADYVSPWWRTGVTRVAQIGAHIFYRWPGAAGALAAFSGQYRGGELRLSDAVLSGRAPRPLQPSDAEPDPTVLALQRIVVADAAAPGGVRQRVRATLNFGPVASLSDRPPATPEQVQAINAAVARHAAEAVGPAQAVVPTTAVPAPVAVQSTPSAKSSASEPARSTAVEPAGSAGAEPAGSDL